MEILYITGFSPISTDPAASASFYRDTIGLPLETINEDYVSVDGFDGAKHFGVWPLAKAAESCFGQPEWPDHLPIPQATVEFEVSDVAAAAAELTAGGHDMIHGPRTEPWGQIVARLMGPEGLLIGLSQMPAPEAP